MKLAQQIVWTTIGWLAFHQGAWAALGDQLLSLLPEAPISGQDFGDAVAIQGSLILVGAEDTNEGGVLSSGAAYLFDAATGTQLHKLTTSDPPASRSFGNAVAIDGGRLIIAAEDENSKQGTAYIFDTDGNQLHKLLASDGAANHEFGQVVAISGNHALVGAPGSSGFRGQVYLFDVTTGLQLGAPIQPEGLPSFAEFGASLDLDGVRAIIGYDLTGRGGGAFIYDTNGTLLHSLLPPIDPVTLNPVRGFGRSVSISGNLALVGATPSDSQVLPNEFGRAYLFDVTTGQQLFELVPSDSQGEDLFGEAVAISGNLALIHARHEDVLGTINTAYLFDVTTGQQILQLDSTGFVAGDEIFESIAIDGGRAVAGVESLDSPGFSNNGTVVVFDVLVGDFNGNGIVDAADYVVWRDEFGQTVAPYVGADANGDSTIDEIDFKLWKVNFGLAAPTSVLADSDGLTLLAAAIPEPATILVLTSALLTQMLLRRKSP